MLDLTQLRSHFVDKISQLYRLFIDAIRISAIK